MVQRIPLTAKAQCADGARGDLSGLVVRADSRTLEYFVVLDNTEGHRIERLVPRTQGHLDPTGVVALDCSYAQLTKMQPLNVQE